MSSFDSISTALTALLAGVTGIGTITDYPTVEFAKYPGAAVFISGVENEYLDSESNFVSHRFTIRVVDEMKTSPDATENRIRKLADAIISALDSSDDLSGAVAQLAPATVQAGFQKGELGEFRVLLIDVVARSANVI